MPSIKNAAAVHGLGVERFGHISEDIANSRDAYEMADVMRHIVETKSAPDEEERIIRFMERHGIKE